MLRKLIALISLVTFILSLAVMPISAEVADIVFEAESYIDSGSVTFTRVSTPKLYYDITEGTFTPSVSGGTFRMNPGNWVAYNVTIPESGAYTISAKVRADSDVNKVGMTVYDTKKGLSAICDNFFVKTENQSYVYQEIGTAYLKSGVNYLRIMNNIKGVSTALYVDSYTISRATSADSSVKNKTFVEAEYYNRYEQGTAANRVRMEGGNTQFKVVLDKTQSVEYDVEIKEEGFYKLGAEIGCTSNITINASCNNGAALQGNMDSTGALGTIMPMEFGVVKLSKGMNTVKISEPSNVIYFDRVTLEKVISEIDIDLSKFDESSSGAAFENGSLTLDADGYALYNFNADCYGSYKAETDAECEIFVDGLAIGDTVVMADGAHTLKIASTEGTTVGEVKLSLIALSDKYIAKDYENFHDDKEGTFVQGANVSFQPNDWVEYTVNIPKDGKYNFSTYGSAAAGSKIFVLENESVLTEGKINNDGNYSTYSLSDLGNATLLKGEHTIRFLTDIYSNGGNGYLFNNFVVTYVGEPEYDSTLAVDEVIASYDHSAGGEALVVRKDSAGIKHISFGKNDYVDIEVFAIKDGVYTFSVLQGSEEKYGMAELSVINSNGSNLKKKAPYSGGIYTYADTELGEILLSKGRNVIRVLNVGSACHLVSMSAEYKDIAPETAFELETENFELGMEGIGYHDNTEGVDDGDYEDLGDDVERIPTDDGYSVDMEAEEWLYYTVSAPKAGFYNIKVSAMTDSTEKTVNVYINDGEEATVCAISGGALDKYMTFNLCDVYLNEGDNTFKFELYSGANVIADKFIFATSDVVAKAEDGVYSASGYLNGLFMGKEVMCVLAVYDGEGRLADIDAKICVGGINDSFSLSSDAEGTAKLFIWGNMSGIVTEIH